MKKTIIILVSVLVLLVGTLTVININTFNLYIDSEHVKYDEVLDDKTTPTLYYYYQDTCHFCNSIKDQVTDLYLAAEDTDQFNVKLVDVKSSTNVDAWADENYDLETADFSNPANIQISGTPAMIYVEDGQVVEYKTGSDIFDIMELVNDKYNLNVEFDRSKYGQE